MPYMFEIPIRDTIPPPFTVIKLEKIKQKGCKVVYKEPEWIQKLDFDISMFDMEPIPRHQSTGEKRVKPEIWRKLDFGV